MYFYYMIIEQVFCATKSNKLFRVQVRVQDFMLPLELNEQNANML